MSDLVGNPEDRFSRVEAHFRVGTSVMIATVHDCFLLFMGFLAICYMYAQIEKRIACVINSLSDICPYCMC